MQSLTNTHYFNNTDTQEQTDISAGFGFMGLQIVLTVDFKPSAKPASSHLQKQHGCWNNM